MGMLSKDGNRERSGKGGVEELRRKPGREGCEM
jgi:hypothetical protein